MEILEEARRAAGEEQDRVMRALQVFVGSGSTVDARCMEETCLRLCNAFRDAKPLLHLRIDKQVPRSLMTIVCPDYPQLETWSTSRVQSYRGTSSVQWTFSGRSGSKGKNERAGREGKTTLTDPTDASLLSKVKWPEGTKDVVLWGIDQPIDHVIWPSTLERLAFGEHDFWADRILALRAEQETFNQSLDRVIFPSSVRELLLGPAFDQPLTQVTWSQELERLSLPGFNQSIHSVRWPSKLKALEFIPPRGLTREHLRENDYLYHGLGRFNQHMGNSLPPTLEVLWLSDKYDHALSKIAWPSGLTKLALGTCNNNAPCQGVKWPSTLRVLFTVEDIDDYGPLPSECKVILSSHTVVCDADLDSDDPDYMIYKDYTDYYDDCTDHDLDYDDCTDHELYYDGFELNGFCKDSSYYL